MATEKKVKSEKTKGKKASVHPKFRMIEITATNGSKDKLASCFGQDTMRLEVDSSTHPAWTHELNYVDQNAGQISKFNSRFGGLSFGSKKDTTASA